MKTVRAIFGLLSLLAWTAALPASAADWLVVVRSNSQAWLQGTKIDGTAVLTLEEGTQLTLISEDGLSLTLLGPYSAAPLLTKPEHAPEGLIESLSPLLADPSNDETVIGAFRTSDDDREALAWLVDAAVLKENSGVICRDASHPLSIARPRRTEWPAASLERLGSGHRAELFFSADVVLWPETLPADEGARFRLTIAGHSPPSEFVVALLPTDLPTPAHRAAWMADHGCRVQARRLILSSY
jgi:hypothetical protein